jgi:serine/threonine-protein kinase HipA
MVFNVLTYNRDDHTKNIAFLMNKQGQWSLAPAFDMTFSYKPDSIWVSRHQMSVNGKRDKITEADILAIANTMNIKKPKAIFEQIQSVAMNWLNYAKDSGVAEPTAKAIFQIITI